MANKNQVTLTFAGDQAQLDRTFASVGDGADRFRKRIGGANDDIKRSSKDTAGFMASSFATATGSIIAGFAGSALRAAGSFFTGMIGEAREAAAVSASTAQGIKTMGAAAWTSAQQVGDLAESISNKIGVDDELIQTSANLLLTFGNVKNAVGENNNVFDRAVIAAQDLAAKGFGDADSAAKMLGKALNDPIKGIAALGKAGVTFTAEQKEQIKTLTESGDILGAQKIIMAELEKQVGGTAEATANGADKMAVKWGNFKEELGTRLLPVMDRLLPTFGKLLDAVMPSMIAMLDTASGFVENNADAIAYWAGKLGLIVQWAAENPKIVAAMVAISAAVGPVTTAIRLLNAVMLANPIVLIVSLIAMLVAAFITAWQTSAEFRDRVKGVWDAIWSVISTVVGAVVGAFEWLWKRGSDIVGWIVEKWNWLWQVGSNVFGAIAGAVGWMVDAIAGAIGWVSNLIAEFKEALGLASQMGNFRRGTGWQQITGRGSLGRNHGGGTVSGMLGTEQIRILQAGEKVIPRGQDGNTGQLGMVFMGNTDTALAAVIMSLYNAGKIQLRAA